MNNNNNLCDPWPSPPAVEGVFAVTPACIVFILLQQEIWKLILSRSKWISRSDEDEKSDYSKILISTMSVAWNKKKWKNTLIHQP